MLIERIFVAAFAALIIGLAPLAFQRPGRPLRGHATAPGRFRSELGRLRTDKAPNQLVGGNARARVRHARRVAEALPLAVGPAGYFRCCSNQATIAFMASVA